MSQPFFILTRHGRTAGNEKNIYRGLSNAAFAQLDENGRQDARDAAIYMKGLGLEFPVILVDDLDRTQETAKIIAEILGVKEIITDKRLRPVDVGDYTGKSKALHPLTEYMNSPAKRIPGGDTLAQFNKRQIAVFGDIVEAIVRLRKETGNPNIMFLVVGHGSNASFLYHNVNKGGKEIGYEGMTEPGGIMTFAKEGITPIFKKKEKKTPLVQLSKWSVLFVGGKDTNDQPKSCFNCHLLYGKQATCSLLGPDITIKSVHKDGKLYTPVCGLQDAGTPMNVSDEDAKYNLNAEVGPEKADGIGLEWAEGKGTNCGGANDGAPCKYFETEDGKDGLCKVIGEKENLVDWDDCCGAHDGPSIPWREAQKILKKED